MLPQSISRSWRRCRYGISLLFSHLRYLWPWLVSTIVFIGFLRSSQGASLASDFNNSPSNYWIVFLSLAMFLLLASCACWFASIVAISHEQKWTIMRDMEKPVSNGHLIAFLVWVSVLAILPALLFSIATSSPVGIVTIIAFVIAMTASVIVSTISADKSRKLWERGVCATREHRYWLSALVTLLSFSPMIIGAFSTIYTPLVLSRFGPILLALIGLSSLAALANLIFILLPRMINAPWTGWIAFLTIIVRAAFSPLEIDRDNPLLRDQRIAATVSDEEWQSRCADQADSPAEEIRVRVVQNEKSGPPKGPTYSPLYLVSAEGGGIRAAYWTAMALENIARGEGKDFGEHLMLLSGVSGGSLGIATFVAGLEVLGATDEQRLRLTTAFLGSDFLSPLISGLFFLDVPRLVFGFAWPTARRDQVFERFLYDRWKYLSGSDFFARPLRRLCFRQLKRAPHLFFNATDATTGSPVVLSNSNFAAEGAFRGLFRNSLDQTSLRWITVAQAVSISARFPFLSPGADAGITAAQVALPGRDHAFFNYAAQHRTEARGLSILSDQARKKKYKTDQEKLFESVENTVNGDLKDAWAQKSEIDQLSEWPKDEVEVVRIGRLVDGGYFDNSALAPVLSAIGEFNKFQKNKNHIMPYRVFHFENDPTEACGPLSNRPSKAREFLRKAKAEVKCDWELEAVEKSLDNDSFQFFSTPFDAIFSVRSIHATQQAQKLKDAYQFDNVSGNRRTIFSLSEEINSVIDNEILFFQRYEEYDGWDLKEQDIMERSAKYSTFLDLAKQKGVGPSELAKEKAYLEKWRRFALSMAKRWNCRPTSIPGRPPLGWMLSEQDRRLIDCTAARSAVRIKLEDSVTPWDRLIQRTNRMENE